MTGMMRVVFALLIAAIVAVSVSAWTLWARTVAGAPTYEGAMLVRRGGAA